MHIDHARPNDVDAIVALLRHHALPTDGVTDRLATTLVARTDGAIAGTAALELYDHAALLRSVAVDASRKGTGVGRELVAAALRLARAAGAGVVYLLTSTAEEDVPRFGFERIARDDVVPAVRASFEFTSACPSSAAVMRFKLEEADHE